MTNASRVAQQRRTLAPTGRDVRDVRGARGVRSRAGGFALQMVVWLSLALVVAQTLGLLHGSLHNPASTGAATEASAQSHTAVAQHDAAMGFSGASGGHSGGHSGASFLTQLFAGHTGDADCRAYDQLSHMDVAPCVAALALPLVLTPFALSTLTGLATARWHALFQARGPPSLR